MMNFISLATIGNFRLESENCHNNSTVNKINHCILTDSFFRSKFIAQVIHDKFSLWQTMEWSLIIFRRGRGEWGGVKSYKAIPFKKRGQKVLALQKEGIKKFWYTET